jgi:hypothetical protein
LPKSLQSRVVLRACELLGGPEVLAERIGISRIIVRAWMTGSLSPPKSYFFRVVDILHEAEPEFLASRGELEDEPPGKAAPAD